MNCTMHLCHAAASGTARARVATRLTEGWPAGEMWSTIMCDEVAVCGSGPDDHSTPQACRVCLDSYAARRTPVIAFRFPTTLCRAPRFTTEVFANRRPRQHRNGPMVELSELAVPCCHTR